MIGSAARWYAASVLLSGAALAVALALFGVGAAPAGRVFLVAVVLSAWWGGVGPALLATALGTLALDYVFDQPPYSLGVDSPRTVLGLGTFVAVALTVSWAGASLRASRARSDAARAELVAVLEAIDDAVTVYDPDGRPLHLNARSRELAGSGTAGPRADGADESPLASALAGRAASRVVLGGSAGDVPSRRYHERATPIRGADGRVRAAVVVTRDVTELHDAVRERSQLDGALKTVRLVAHEVNNGLALTVGCAELLVDAVDGAPAELARQTLAGAERAALVLARLQRIVRFEETDRGAGPMLDLDAATGGPDAAGELPSSRATDRGSAHDEG